MGQIKAVNRRDLSGMRIVFLLTQDLESPSGLGRYYPLAKELVKLGHEVNILALHPAIDTLAQRRVKREGVHVHYVGQMHVRKEGNFKIYFNTFQLLAVAMASAIHMAWESSLIEADVFHLGKPQPINGLAALLGAKLLRGKPLYLDCDDYEAESNRFQNKWQKKIVACFEDNLPKFAEGLTVNTLFTKERNIALGFPEERIVYVPNGVDRQRFNNIEIREVERLRLEWGAEDKKIVIYVGSLSLINHPVDLLLRAFAIVSLEIPKAVLFVVGGGEDFEILKHQADALGLSDRVIFIGRIKPEEVPYYFKMADVSVDPVIDDFIARARSPLKIFESLAVGTPVVTGDVGDRRAILDGRAGILVEPGKADALAEGILTILADENRTKAMSESALELCEKYYWDVLVRDFVKVYY